MTNPDLRNIQWLKVKKYNVLIKNVYSGKYNVIHCGKSLRWGDGDFIPLIIHHRKDLNNVQPMQVVYCDGT